MAHELEVPDRVVLIAFGVTSHRLQVVGMGHESSKTSEIIIASVLRIEIACSLATMLPAGGFDQPVNGIIDVIGRRVVYHIGRKPRQGCIPDVGNVSRWIVSVAQVLHNLWIGEEL